MFETDFGSGIANKLFLSLSDQKVLFVTQENLFLKYSAIIPKEFLVQCIENVEESYLINLNLSIESVDAVVGFGGGMSIDAAKYIAWKRELPCYLVPTAISVDACYSYPIALRKNSVVCYEGEVIPKNICVDYDIIRTAPKMLNLSGVGDVLSCYTALFDWNLMSNAGKGIKVVESLYNHASEILDEIFLNAYEIAEMSDKGIQIIMNGYAWVGVEGYNNRFCHFEEGSEHYLAYTVESICGKHLLHGQLVCLCAYIMSKLQNEGRQIKVKEFTDKIGLSISPSDVGLTLEEIEAALKRVNAFAKENNLSYSVLNEKQVTEEFIVEVIKELKAF